MHAGALCLLLLSWGGFSGAAAGDTLRAAQVTGAVERPVAAPSDTVSAFRLGGGVSAAEAMKGLGGLQVKDYGGAGGLKTVDVRSLGSAHTAVFLDGIAVDNAQNQQVDLGRFSAGSLSGIALYNGQASSGLMSAREYGSASAVYLETAAPRFDASSDRVQALLRGGSFATFSPSLCWEHRFSPRLSLRASCEGVSSSGRYPFRAVHYEKGPDGFWRGYDTTLVRENGDLASLRADIQLFGADRRSEWSAKAYAYLSERGYPGPVLRRPAVVPLSADRQDDGDFFLQGRYRRHVSERYSFQVLGKWAELRTHYASHPERNPMAIPYDNRYRQHQGYLSVAHRFRFRRGFSLQAATDLGCQALDGEVPQFVRPVRCTFSGAAAARYERESFRACASLMGQLAADRYDKPQGMAPGREDRSRTGWSPALIVGYDPWKWLSLSGFVKRSCRMPSFNDLYYTLVGNSNLLPEYADQADLSARVTVPAGALQLRLVAEGWKNRVRDKIVAVPTANQFRWSMFNIGAVDVTGADAMLSADYAGRDPKGLQASVSLRYTFQQALDRTDPESLTFGNQIPYVPRHSATASAEARWRGWSARWMTLVTGRRFSSSANLPEYAVAPWSTTDVDVARCFSDASVRWLRPVTLRLSLRNLFGRQYEIVRGYPMPGLNALVSLQVLLD